MLEVTWDGRRYRLTYNGIDLSDEVASISFSEMSPQDIPEVVITVRPDKLRIAISDKNSNIGVQVHGQTQQANQSPLSTGNGSARNCDCYDRSFCTHPSTC